MAGQTILRALLAITIAVTVCAGCDDADSAPPAVIHDLAEPWQAAPFPVDPAIIAGAQRVCRDPAGGALPDATMPLVLADTRGGNFLFLMFANGFNDGQCFVERGADGRFVSQGGGGSLGGNVRAPLPPNGIEFGGGGSQSTSRGPGLPDDTKSFGTGRVGDGVAVVEVVLADNTSLQASLNAGWYAAWWPSDASVKVVRAYDRGGSMIGSAP
jgi:hypothetical protein